MGVADVGDGVIIGEPTGPADEPVLCGALAFAPVLSSELPQLTRVANAAATTSPRAITQHTLVISETTAPRWTEPVRWRGRT